MTGIKWKFGSYDMYAEIKKKENGSIRKIKIQMDNGDIFTICEDIEKFIEITKEYSDKGERLNINPRMGNQITIN